MGQDTTTAGDVREEPDGTRQGDVREEPDGTRQGDVREEPDGTRQGGVRRGGDDPRRLAVLPSSGKVEQLRRDMADDPPPISSLRTATDPANAPAQNPNAPPEHRLLEGKVIEAVRQVFDPEIPVNIYELGLIYAIDVRPDRSVNVRMTLTTPACPVAGSLPGEVERRIEAIPEVAGATIELVWDPPWDRSMMSEAAMLQLGMF